VTLHRLAEMNPTEIAQRLATKPMLILPFGTIEWHSHHLPLGLDGLIADDIAEAIAERCDAVLAPVSYWAVGGVPFPYTLALSVDLIEPVLVSVFEQFAAMGFRVIVAFTGHFGLDQTMALKRSAAKVMRRAPVTIAPLTPYDLVTDVYLGDHAGAGETSLLLACRPDLVHLDAVPLDQPLDGVIGDDPRAEAESGLGTQIRQTIIERISALAQRLWEATSPVDRQYFIEAIDTAARALAELSAARRTRPRIQVPPVQTPPYIAHCAALWAGDYRGARTHAEAKRAETSAELGAVDAPHTPVGGIPDIRDPVSSAISTPPGSPSSAAT
jgi:creatinine amidohydrolase